MVEIHTASLRLKRHKWIGSMPKQCSNYIIVCDFENIFYYFRLNLFALECLCELARERHRLQQQQQQTVREEHIHPPTHTPRLGGCEDWCHCHVTAVASYQHRGGKEKTRTHPTYQPPPSVSTPTPPLPLHFTGKDCTLYTK